MHRNDTSRFLLYIEPKKEEKLENPIEDELTNLMELAFNKSTEGCSNYSNTDQSEEFFKGGFKGWHTVDCGETSSNHDYLLENNMIVNSLCVFYVKWYRNSIHKNDWMKLKSLGKFYNIEINPYNVYWESPKSTKKKSYEEHIEDLKNDMVDVLSKEINKQILEDIKKL